MPSNEAEQGPRFKFLPLSIRLETKGGIANPIVLKGTPLPAKRSEVFTTAEDNQSSIEVHALIGDSPLVKRCISLAKVRLKGIPGGPKGTPQVRVTFEVDQRLAVRVNASVDGGPLKGSGEPIVIDANHLTDEAIQELRATAEQHEKEDQHQVSVIEAVQSAENAIRKAEEQLASATTQGDDRKRTAQQIAVLGQALETEDVERIRECTRSLESSLSSGLAFDFDTIFNDLLTKPPSRAPRQSQPATRKYTPPPPASPVAPAAAVARSAASHLPLGRIFGGGDFTLDPTLCFVLMPFAETFRPIYEDHIRPIIQSEGLTCLRADEIRGTSLITRDIWEKINRARFLIADLTGQNPNVFYEAGLAHALGKDVLLLTQTMTDVPFDLKAMRCIVYSYTPRGMNEMEVALRATVSALTKSG